MEYSLTEQDIAKLEALNFYPSPNDKPMPGELATMEEMISLGVNTVDPELEVRNITPEITPVGTGGAGTGNTPDGPSVTGMNPQMQQLLDLMKQQQAAASKPASQSYTKDQKRMLAYAGIADAGRALQGKEGTSVASLIGSFTDLADQQRKAQNALAQRQMIGSMMGGMSNVASMTDPDQIRAAIADLTNILAVAPSMEPFVKMQIENLYKQLDKAEGDIKSVTDTQTQINLVDSLLDADLSQVAGVKNFMNSIFEPFGLAKKYQNIESMLKQLEGLNFVDAYQALKGGGPITDIEGKAATAAKSRVRNSIGGSEEDIRAALEETKRVFNEALRKNPAYADRESEKNRLLKKWSRTGNEG
jgi:hypothetical protein|tara:strand:+ start:4145 stop:5224 length:1080 start_codon:yes stop_codon:yes gene_type:complete